MFTLVNITLANTGTIYLFRTARAEDERMVIFHTTVPAPIFLQGEIASLPSYHFYMRLGALNPEEPFSGVTTPVHVFDQSRIDEVVESSQEVLCEKYETFGCSPKTSEKCGIIWGKVKVVVP